jgi:hypothetical protein
MRHEFSALNLEYLLPPSSQGLTMKKSFVFIFRKGTRQLSEEEQKRRTDEVRTWALQQIKDARGLDPRILDEESVHLGESATNSTGEGSVIALNFIQAADFSEAVATAKTHPGLRYGVNIEVRPWSDPRA